MKSFVSALMQGSAPVACTSKPAQVANGSDDDYVAVLDSGNMTTVELADHFDVSPCRAMKVLCRLEGDMRVRRAGSEKSGGQRDTIVWTSAPELPADFTHAKRVTEALWYGPATTQLIAKRVGINYYSALAACKKLELSG